MRVFYFYYSPFLGVPDFNESDVYYHGATAVAIEAEILNSTAQVKQVLARMRKHVALACAPATNCSAATIAETLAPALCRREAGASNAGAHDAADMSQALVADAIAWLIANVDDLVRAAEGAEDLLD